MSFDFSFTKDPEWIEQRDRDWKEWLVENSDEWSKRDLIAFQKYFMTGKVNATVLRIPTLLFHLCPCYSYEAFSYICRNYIDPAKIFNWPLQFKSISAGFVLSIDYWFGADHEKKLMIFHMVYGDSYDPNRKFPFLFYGEDGYRDLNYDANGLQCVMMGCFSAACYAEGAEELSVHLDLLDYIISIFPYNDEWLFSISLTEKQEKEPIASVDAGTFNRRLKKLMAYASHPPEYLADGKYYDIVKKKLRYLQQYFDTQTDSKVLKGLWEKVKSEPASE
jgi:hypothetical protein